MLKCDYLLSLFLLSGIFRQIKHKIQWLVSVGIENCNIAAKLVKHDKLFIFSKITTY